MTTIWWFYMLSLLTLTNKLCAVAGVKRKFIVFADADDKTTKYISLNDNRFIARTLFYLSGNQRPISLDYDPVEDRVYWSDVAQGLIRSVIFNITSTKTLFRCNVKSPEGLAIDHVGRNIYWTDSGTDRIEVSTLDGTKRKLLFKDGLDKPRAIVLDERNGTMYWSDWGTNPKIERAGMDGSARQTIVTGNLATPCGLAIDQTANRLFWTDPYLNKIEVSNLDGRNRHLVVLTSIKAFPFGLAVYENMLYWTDWGNKGISRYNLSSGRQDMIVTGLKKPMDIHVFDPSLIFSGPHNCSQDNGNCSDFCLLKPGGYQCACPTGIVLKSDGRTCDYDTFYMKSAEKFMIFAEGDSGEIYKVPLAVPETPCYPLGITTGISRPVAVDYDPGEGKIYWTDVTLKRVARAFPNGSSVEVIAYSGVQIPAGLAVDYVGRNIFWTDEGTSKIEVARLDGSSRRGLITTNIEKPRAVMLDISERKMYWGSRGSSSKIEQSNMDGSARKVLVSSGLVWVNSLALDYQNRLLYWCDAKLDKIERVDLRGNNRKLILDLTLDERHPFGLALSGDVLYWSDWNTRSVHQYNMKSAVQKDVVRGMGTPMELHIYDHTQTFNVKQCPQLKAPANGNIQPCFNWTGETCHFSCKRSYNLTGSRNRRCSSNGTWTGTQTHCNVNRCPELSAPAHGSLEPCTNLPGQTCLFSCNKGYNLTGSTTRTCNSYGKWTGKQTRCKASHCPKLTAPSNGRFQSCSTLIGQSCKFSCNKGYNLTGSTSRTCNNDGRWTGTQPECKVSHCLQLIAPANGSMQQCSNLVGQICTFFCDKGYNLTGSTTRTCSSSGAWTGTQTYCNVIPTKFGKRKVKNNDNKDDATSWKKYIPLLAVAVSIVTIGAIGVFIFCVLKYRAGSKRNFAVDENVAEFQNQAYHPDEINQSSSQGGPRGSESDVTIFNGHVVPGGSALTTGRLHDNERNSQDREIHAIVPEVSSGVSSKSGHYFGKDDEPVTENHCLNISPHIGVHWKNVLRKLSMAEMTINNIEEDHKHCKVTEKCYQGLLAWKESVGPQKATTKKLGDALRQAGCLQALEASLLKEDTANINNC